MRTASGLGLGLSIVDRIARVLEHPVTLASVAGRGTDFRVRVPIDAGAGLRSPASTRTARAPQATPLTGLTVLVIDNEPKILEGMRLLLTGWGCTVRGAAALRDIAEIERTEPPAPSADVIVADYHLDDGDGIEAIRRLRRHWRAEIPALLVTADRTAEMRARADAADIAVQNKPVRPAALRAFLNQSVAVRRSAAE